MLGYYHPEEEARSPSPVLEPITVVCNNEDTPPPYVPTSSSSPSSLHSVRSAESRRKSGRAPLSATLAASINQSRKNKGGKPKPGRKKRKVRHRPCQGDAVLITYLDPNRPDIAQEAGQHALNSASQSETEDSATDGSGDEGNDEDNDNDDSRHYDSNLHRISSTSLTNVTTKRTPQNPSSGHQVTVDSPRRTSNDRKEHSNEILRKKDGHSQISGKPITPGAVGSAAKKGRLGAIDSIASSPALAQHTISPIQANQASMLPAINVSTPQSVSAYSPEASHSLPSLQTALGQIADVPITDAPRDTASFPYSSTLSPPTSRLAFCPGHSFVPPAMSPSEYSQPSPSFMKETSRGAPSSAGHPNLSRQACKQEPLSIAISLSSAPFTPALTPVAAYPTPNRHPSPSEMDRVSLRPRTWSRSSLNRNPGPLGNGPVPVSATHSTTPPSRTDSVASAPMSHGPVTSTTVYRCTHPKCTAEPFQTQYLLNSHANVHSSSRPYYCPVPSCSRSIGGKGFKRKNEANRHGLVHDSPGYSCPFCLGQQHKYPRPDNLQR